MSSAFIPTVYAARDPKEGRPVYLSAEGWVPELARAEVAMDADEDVILAALGRAGERKGHVTDLRALPVRLAEGGPAPLALDASDMVAGDAEPRSAEIHPFPAREGGRAAQRHDRPAEEPASRSTARG